MTIILGIDPSINKVGFGAINVDELRISHLEDGVIVTKPDSERSEKLAFIYHQLKKVISRLRPDEVAVEQIFVNVNPSASLRLGEARGIALMVPVLYDALVFEYTPNLVKKTICGNGHADKRQVGFMVKRILPRCKPESEDAADALAIALTHAQIRVARIGLSRIARARNNL